MSEDPLRDLRWSRRAERHAGRSVARRSARLAMLLLASVAGVRLLIWGGVSYSWLEFLRAIESYLAVLAFSAVAFALLAWLGSRRQRGLFERPAYVRDGIIVLVVLGGVVLLALYLVM